MVSYSALYYQYAKIPVTRVSTHGLVSVTFIIVIRDSKKLGYDVSRETTLRFSEFPISAMIPGIQEQKHDDVVEVEALKIQENSEQERKPEITEDEEMKTTH